MPSVASNLAAYAQFVTPGSYLIVQDTRAGRFVGAAQAVADFLGARGEGQARFVRDRRPEYLLYTQHSGGFLRRLAKGEEPGPYDFA